MNKNIIITLSLYILLFVIYYQVQMYHEWFMFLAFTIGFNKDIWDIFKDK